MVMKLFSTHYKLQCKCANIETNKPPSYLFLKRTSSRKPSSRNCRWSREIRWHSNRSNPPDVPSNNELIIILHIRSFARYVVLILWYYSILHSCIKIPKRRFDRTLIGHSQSPLHSFEVLISNGFQIGSKVFLTYWNKIRSDKNKHVIRASTLNDEQLADKIEIGNNK